MGGPPTDPDQGPTVRLRREQYDRHLAGSGGAEFDLGRMVSRHTYRVTGHHIGPSAVEAGKPVAGRLVKRAESLSDSIPAGREPHWRTTACLRGEAAAYPNCKSRFATLLAGEKLIRPVVGLTIPCTDRRVRPGVVVRQRLGSVGQTRLRERIRRYARPISPVRASAQTAFAQGAGPTLITRPAI